MDHGSNPSRCKCFFTKITKIVRDLISSSIVLITMFKKILKAKVQSFGRKKWGYLESFPGVLKNGSFYRFRCALSESQFATSYLCRSLRHIGKMAPKISFLTISPFRHVFMKKTFMYKMKAEEISYNICYHLFPLKWIVLAYEGRKLYFTARLDQKTHFHTTLR